mgnify:CR=1 FL=1
MKNILSLLLIGYHTMMFSQNFDSKDWTVNDMYKIPMLTITKSENLKHHDLTFKIKWNPSLSYSNNIGSYGGIGEMKIYYKDQYLQTIKNIEDGVALGEIYMFFFDFNLDGYLDFSIREDCGKSCYDQYYLYNVKKRRFKKNEAWFGLQISKVNKKTKQILSVPEGTAVEGEQILYNVINNKLTVHKLYTYGNRK